jgi:hypothetical protein
VILKKQTMKKMVLIGYTIIIFGLTFTNYHNTFGQPSNSITIPSQGSDIQLVSPSTAPVKNYTSSIAIIPSLLEVINTKINVTLDDAIAIAVNETGINSSPLSASLQANRGFLVYRVILADSNNNIHLIVVDPGKGSVLSRELLPISTVSSLIAGIPLS